jgi:hypothetical protein
MEKEEAYSLRHALHDMDLKDQRTTKGESPDDKRLYEAALQEAAELVWQYEHGGLPAAKPNGPYRYRPHLRENSYAHARTASVGRYGDDIQASGLARNCSRSVSGSSTGSDGVPTRRSMMAAETQDPDDLTHKGDTERPFAKPYSGIGSGQFAVPNKQRRSSMKRNISGEIEAPFSEDQIWKEPENSSTTTPAGPREPNSRSVLERKGRNPLNCVRFSTGRGENAEPTSKLVSTIEIHRNPPSRKRDPKYVTNSQLPRNTEPAEDVTRKHGVEIRGDDIRQATSMRLADRSEKLPTPSAVSGDPGRPIVSFDTNWTQPEEKDDGARERNRSGAKMPSIPSIVVGPGNDSCSRPIPTIQEPSSTPAPPVITVDDCEPAAGIPVIVTPAEGNNANPRPLPQPTGASKATTRQRMRPRAPCPPPGTTARGAAMCHECGTQIQGRFVALSGSSEKFHPGCFCCYACGTGLEALEISPEPDSFRNERLDRIRRRAAGEILDERPGNTMAEDGDDRLRFYCHLDWHELFAPRCKHCKTPILGEHIVATGEHWHYGHFFCAECGDPFEQGMTHIEKDGYAWCINCQTKRTERRAPKCKKCKLAVVGQYIQALGSDWHDQCFRCTTCEGAFEDGQIFPKEDEQGNTLVLCTGCRSRELKQ